MIEWVLFNGEFEVASKKSKCCKTADLDLIFIAVDAKATKVHKQRVEDEKKKAEAERQAASTAKERALLLKKQRSEAGGFQPATSRGPPCHFQ